MTKKKAVLATLHYFDHFQYPLTAAEVYRWAPERLERKTVDETLSSLVKQKKVATQSSYYFLPGHHNMVQRRQSHHQPSAQKLVLLNRYLPVLCHLGVKFLGVSGSLAWQDASRQDDIDLLVITPAGRLWWSRFWLTLVTTLLGWRRRPKTRPVANKLCFNIFLDSHHLTFGEARQNIYTAHELLQLRPVWDPEGIYQRLLEVNQWAKDFLPQAYRRRYQENRLTSKNDSDIFPAFLEKLFKSFQLAYMKRRGEEKINSGQLFFHPKDKTKEVLADYHPQR